MDVQQRARGQDRGAVPEQRSSVRVLGLHESVTTTITDTTNTSSSTPHSSTKRRGPEDSNENHRRLPQGPCRYYPFSAGPAATVCSCQAFWLEKPGESPMCACGHHACHHANSRKRPRTDSDVGTRGLQHRDGQTRSRRSDASQQARILRAGPSHMGRPDTITGLKAHKVAASPSSPNDSCASGSTNVDSQMSSGSHRVHGDIMASVNENFNLLASLARQASGLQRDVCDPSDGHELPESGYRERVPAAETSSSESHLSMSVPHQGFLGERGQRRPIPSTAIAMNEPGNEHDLRILHDVKALLNQIPLGLDQVLGWLRNHPYEELSQRIGLLETHDSHQDAVGKLKAELHRMQRELEEHKTYLANHTEAIKALNTSSSSKQLLHRGSSRRLSSGPSLHGQSSRSSSQSPSIENTADLTRLASNRGNNVGQENGEALSPPSTSSENQTRPTATRLRIRHYVEASSLTERGRDFSVFAAGGSTSHSPTFQESAEWETRANWSNAAQEPRRPQEEEHTEDLYAELMCLDSMLSRSQRVAPHVQAVQLDVIFLPWSRQLAPLWQQREHALAPVPAPSQDLPSRWTDIQTSHQSLNQCGPGSTQGWDGQAIADWAHHANQWYLPSNPFASRALYYRLVSRGFVLRLRLAPESHQNLESVIVNAYRGLLANMGITLPEQYRSATARGKAAEMPKADLSDQRKRLAGAPMPPALSDTYRGLSNVFVPLHHKSGRSQLQFLKPRHLVRQDLSKQFSRAMAHSSQHEAVLFVTTSDAYIQAPTDPEQDWTWSKIRRLPRVGVQETGKKQGTPAQMDTPERSRALHFQSDPSALDEARSQSSGSQSDVASHSGIHDQQLTHDEETEQRKHSLAQTTTTMMTATSAWSPHAKYPPTPVTADTAGYVARDKRPSVYRGYGKSRLAGRHRTESGSGRDSARRDVDTAYASPHSQGGLSSNRRTPAE